MCDACGRVTEPICLTHIASSRLPLIFTFVFLYIFLARLISTAALASVDRVLHNNNRPEILDWTVVFLILSYRVLEIWLGLNCDQLSGKVHSCHRLVVPLVSGLAVRYGRPQWLHD